MRDFGVIPFINLQNDTKQQLNSEKGKKKNKKNEWRIKPIICFRLSYIVFVSSDLIIMCLNLVLEC